MASGSGVITPLVTAGAEFVGKGAVGVEEGTPVEEFSPQEDNRIARRTKVRAVANLFI
jgi:hypothetical protein